jgi:putative FmdB family regulatory protein
LPIYEYRCRQGHTFEVMQSMNDEPVATCAECRSPVERVFRPVAVHFKGSGFYTTDYGRKRGGSSSDSAGAGDGKGESKEGSSAKTDGASSASNGTSTGSAGGAKTSESSTGDQH